MDYFGPVEGSPLIPSEFIYLYFGGFLLFLFLLFLFIHRWKRSSPIVLRMKIFFFTAISIQLLLTTGAGLIAIYYLAPKPSVVTTVPRNDLNNSSVRESIEIVFNRPVKRKTLKKSMSPDIPGIWVFENPLYTTHLYRKLVFYPHFSLKPETKYTVTLSSIKNFLPSSPSYTYSFSFQTQTAPNIAKIELVDQVKTSSNNPSIKVHLDRPNNSISQFDFELSPSLPVDISLHPSNTYYILKPLLPFSPGTTYTLKAKRTDLVWNLKDKTVFARTPTKLVYSKTLTSPQVLGIQSFKPSEENVLIDTPVTLVFSEAMNRKSAEQEMSIKPSASGAIAWPDDKTLIFTPQKWAYDTKYTFKIGKKAKTVRGSFLREDIIRSFTTIGRVKIIGSFPENGWTGIAVDNVIKVRFNQKVEQASAESKFSLSPSVPGSFGWEGETMTFKPDSDLSYSTQYTIRVSQGIKSISGLDSLDEFSSSFTTQESISKLEVPVYLQKYALSCEAASLRMLLAYRGINVSEKELLSHIGNDATPHQGSIWGNPYVGFVGSVNGKQMVNGYGVYWGPIARVANKYRYAISFEEWNIKKLTEALSKSQPVIIWGYVKNGQPTYWHTPGGDKIYAVPDEHTVIAVGFVGAANNPSHIIINDPLVGQVYWSREIFDKKWDAFGRSGVVVY